MLLSRKDKATGILQNKTYWKFKSKTVKFSIANVKKKQIVFKSGIQSVFIQSGIFAQLRPKFFGPYKVIKVKNNDRYYVEKLGF